MTEQGQKPKRARRYETRWTVRAADRVASVLITIGGVGTILAVSAVCLFLASVVVPLFLPGSADDKDTVALEFDHRSPLHLAVDEYRVAGWTFLADGSVTLFRLDTGALLAEQQVVDGTHLTAWSFAGDGDAVAFGFDDGGVRLGTIGFRTDFPGAEVLPADVTSLEVGEVVAVGSALVERTPEGQFRRQRLEIELDEPLIVSDGAAVKLVDYVEREAGPVVVTLDADGALRLSTVKRFENLMTGEIVSDIRSGQLPKPRDEAAQPLSTRPPSYLKVSESGTSVYVVWANGYTLRYDTRSFDTAGVAERVSLTGGGGDLVSLDMLIGRSTLVTGDGAGRVATWFQYNAPGGRTVDGVSLVRAQELARGNAAVTALAPSPRSRVVAVGYADGTISVFQATSGARVIAVDTGTHEPVERLVIAPKNNGLIALGAGTLTHWDIDLRHPEATLKALFTPVWYEGYERPAHVWQSSSGTDDFEPKFGLWPLVFGTLKATFYSMLFGVPLALLAAVFSSEFLVPSLRNRIKTLIEFMASLPSVVLGFLAALVFAPFVQKVVPTALMGFLTIPGTFLLGAYAWQFLPQRTTLILERYRLPFVLALLPVGMLLAVWLGPVAERVLFVGDMKLWLNGNEGSGFGGWLLLLLPLSGAGAMAVIGRWVTPWIRTISAQWERWQVALADAGRFGAGAVVAIAIAVTGAWLLRQIGLDPRGPHGFLDTYVQRNALVVGFIMGFAIIPIIYTIAEDALTAVPEHLRAASLGAGATPWQTAIRIVIPTAMSGLFSAVMIGLGRAVGETMIVLMAAGNTPVLEMNIFNGFRTLSANIAVELPEAVRDSTHYRTLFLAALILFVMTFLINTVAEIVRLRFRRRAVQL